MTGTIYCGSYGFQHPATQWTDWHNTIVVSVCLMIWSSWRIGPSPTESIQIWLICFQHCGGKIIQMFGVGLSIILQITYLSKFSIYLVKQTNIWNQQPQSLNINLNCADIFFYTISFQPFCFPAQVTSSWWTAQPAGRLRSQTLACQRSWMTIATTQWTGWSWRHREQGHIGKIYIERKQTAAEVPSSAI